VPYLKLMLQQKKKTAALIEWLKLSPEEVDFLNVLKMF
jgi:hypothetical protein